MNSEQAILICAEVVFGLVFLVFGYAAIMVMGQPHEGPMLFSGVAAISGAGLWATETLRNLMR